ncbi:MAG: NAD(P)H-dependent oxidoreductase subunit E [Acidimicrobiales bacterium]|nr:NAD(P)H-dependent oxidoreductase subunit E [Acidimicrobiales bacterium]
MPDLHLGPDRATDVEAAAVDAVVGPVGSAVLVEDERLVRGGTARRRERRHLLLPALHALQDEVGWISPGAVNHLADRLQVAPADVYGVATFYDLLRTTAPELGRATTHVCVDPSCRIAGADSLATRLEAEGWAVERSACLGRCEQAPARWSAASGGDASPPPVVAAGRLLARVGTVDPTSLDAYVAAGGFRALAVARAVGADAVIDAVTAAGLTGRGGAAFPTGLKWRAVRDAPGGRKHVVVNGDESEPGTFKDRVLMEHDPFAVVEAMAIAALVTRATDVWIYVRGEYPVAAARVASAVEQARAGGHLGPLLDVHVRRGAGAYVCGEETALFASIEGLRGEPRNKPPFPTTHGLFGEPTAVNNPETLVNVLPILLDGAERYRSAGTEQSPGTRLFCLSGRIVRPGVYEAPFGTTLGELLDRAGGVVGTLAAVLLGGAAGSFVGPDRLDLRLTLEDARAAGLSLGSGAVVVFDDTVELADVVERIAAFFRHESCGQCVPCRVGTVRQHEAVVRVRAGSEVDAETALLDDLGRAMADASICGLGHTATSAVRSALALGLVGGRP